MYKDDIKKQAADFNAKQNLGRNIANIVPTLHLMNHHGLDVDSALDQTSVGANDFGIDAWFYHMPTGSLIIYQSKFTDNKQKVLNGFYDFFKAMDWLELALINEKLEVTPQNIGIRNLWTKLAQIKAEIKKIEFVLLSLINRDLYLELNQAYYNNLIQKPIYSKYIPSIKSMGYTSEINNNESEAKTYGIERIKSPLVQLANQGSLIITYLQLYSLIEIYRERGDLLFHKNVRLSIRKSKESKDLVVNPMIETFEQICNGNKDANIFPFYHVGITLSAIRNKSKTEGRFELEQPNIVNGCQTVTIADDFLSKLEKEQNIKKIELFKSINVLAKVVIGTSDDTLREITNSNNRQNPIQNWQLYSNDSIQYPNGHAHLAPHKATA